MKVKSVIISSFVPGLYEYMIKTFKDINFYFIPVQRVLSKIEPMLNNKSEEMLSSSEVIMADAAIGAQLLKHSPKLIWLQAVSAGVDPFFKHIDRNKIPSNLIFTRMTNVFGNVMAEYVICQIINHERHFFQIHENQKLHKWDQIGWGYRCLSNLTIGIMGLGEIGREIAKLCKDFGATTIGLSRSVKGHQETYIDTHKAIEELPSFLESCDYIISILPSTLQTKGLLNNDVLKHCKNKEAIFINIGRGDLISDDEIIKAINNKWIGGAILDVFSEEPLPSTHPFWSIPEIGKVFKENLKLYEEDKPLLGIVDLERQY